MLIFNYQDLDSGLGLNIVKWTNLSHGEVRHQWHFKRTKSNTTKNAFKIQEICVEVFEMW